MSDLTDILGTDESFRLSLEVNNDGRDDCCALSEECRISSLRLCPTKGGYVPSPYG